MFISDSCKYACTSLQLTPQLPSGLFAKPSLDSGGVDDGDRPKSAGDGDGDGVWGGGGGVMRD